MTNDEPTLLVNLVARLMKADFTTTVLQADDKALKSKSVTGKFPVLETSEGSRVCENLPIAKYFSREHPSFYGSSSDQSKS